MIAAAAAAAATASMVTARATCRMWHKASESGDAAAALQWNGSGGRGKSALAGYAVILLSEYSEKRYGGTRLCGAVLAEVFFCHLIQS